MKKCKVNSKVISLQTTKYLFAKILLVVQIRSLNMRVAFQFPLGPLPWSLAELLGSLKKPFKALLHHKLDVKVESLESLNGQHTLIADGMVVKSCQPKVWRLCQQFPPQVPSGWSKSFPHRCCFWQLPWVVDQYWGKKQTIERERYFA